MVKLVENIKWKMKYNKLCVEYEELANKKINELEKYNEILLQNIEYRKQIDIYKKEIIEYRIKLDKPKGGGKNDKNKSKR